MTPTTLRTNQLRIADGWTEANETWTYASASTITVPTGAASRYQKGDRIKWTQTTVKYGVIVTVADTLLTIAVNTDYTVANAAISANYYSHQATPVGFPNVFAYTPTPTNITLSNGTIVGSYQLNGKQCTGRARFTFGSSSSISGTMSFSLPFTAADTGGIGSVYMENSGVQGYFGFANLINTTTIALYTDAGAPTSSTVPFTWGTADYFVLNFTYLIA